MSYQKRRDIMLAVPYEERLVEKILKQEGYCFVQPKLNGERCRAKWSEKYQYWQLFSSTGAEIISVLHINEALRVCDFPRELHFDGELYTHGMSFEEIASIVSTTSGRHEEAQNLQYHIFDLCDLTRSNESRFNILRGVDGVLGIGDFSIQFVPTYLASSLPGVDESFNSYVEQGYEGIIIRSPSALYHTGRKQNMLKFKPRCSDVYTIVGILEAVSSDGVPLQEVGAIVCADPEGNTFKVGTGAGVTIADKREIFQNRVTLIGKEVLIQYQTKSRYGTPLFGKFIKILDS